ncbi:MAG: GNAT family N-acetyltransferase [Chitinophagales bacterium]
MPFQNEYKLDNPVWHSLNEEHARLSINFDGLKCYHPDYCSFCAYENGRMGPGQINEYALLINEFFIVGEKQELSFGLNLKKELICFQMTIDKKFELDNHARILLLSGQFERDLFELVNLVQPGYFRPKTSSMGEYYGIFEDGILVAAAGERMKMNSFTEVSAIVTHPHFRKKGFARQLTGHVVNKVLDEGKMAYLHVAETNAAAIRLYQNLGFSIRRKISFWNFMK